MLEVGLQGLITMPACWVPESQLAGGGAGLASPPESPAALPICQGIRSLATEHPDLVLGSI